MKTLPELLSESDISTNQKFVQKIYSMAFPVPFGSGVVFSYRSDTPNEPNMIKVDLIAMHDNVHLSEIVVLEDKGKKGLGDHVMKIITKEADKMGIDMTLSAVPLAHKGKKIPKGKLIKFYKKHGFKVERGDNMTRMQKRKPIKLSGRMKQIDI